MLCIVHIYCRDVCISVMFGWACGEKQKLLRNLVFLVWRLRNLFPEVRTVRDVGGRSHWWCRGPWTGSAPWLLPGWERETSTSCSCPHKDAAGQEVLCGGESGRGEMCRLHPVQKVPALLGFLHQNSDKGNFQETYQTTVARCFGMNFFKVQILFCPLRANCTF